MTQLTVFGKEVKKKLVDIGQSQAWLMDKINGKTGLFIDSGYMYKILTGKRNAPKIVSAIRDILELPGDEKEAGRGHGTRQKFI